MLAKVPKKRTDGRSSFAALVAYISKHASTLRCSDALWSVETAADEMTQVSLMNERVKDPVYQYVLSWPALEHPTDSLAFIAVEATLRELNMIDHQWVAAVHRNTRNVHAHVAVNRVHPGSFACVSPRHDWLLLDRMCRALELEHGWHHDRGPHTVERSDVFSPRIVRSARNPSTFKGINPSTKARDFSAWTGLENFQSWVAREPANHLRRALNKTRPSWQDVHHALGRFNLEYRLKGSGAVVVDRDDPDHFHAKASHLGRFASKSKLEAQLGVYSAAQKSPDQTNDVSSPHATNSQLGYVGNVVNRPSLERTLGRGKGDSLYERYVQSCAKSSVARNESRVAWDRQRQSERERLATFTRQNRQVRERIRQIRDSLARRVLYSYRAWTAAAWRQTLRQQFIEERTQLREHERPGRHPGWREWLHEQAIAGNESARKRLRGIRLRERRSIKPLSAETRVGWISSSALAQKVSFDRYRAIVDTNGINYSLGSGVAFRDEGRRVAFYNGNDAVIRAGLLLCREKWGSTLTMAGFQQSQGVLRSIGSELGVSFTDADRQRTRNDPELQPTAVEQTVIGVKFREPPIRELLELLSRDLAKPVTICEARPGARYTGKIMAVLTDESSRANIVVLDIGRTLGAMHADLQTAIECRTRIGETVLCRSMSPRRQAAPNWQFRRIERNRSGPQHQR